LAPSLLSSERRGGRRGAMNGTGDVLRRSALFRAHRWLLVRRAPAFVAAWLGSVAIWHAVLVMQGRLAIPVAAMALVAQIALGLGAIAAVRAVPMRGVLPALVASAVALGWAVTAVFAAAGGSGDFLAFLLLLLYLGSSLFFAWGAFPGVVVLGMTLV